MEKPLESRIRSSKSTTPPKPPHGHVGHTPSPELNPRLDGSNRGDRPQHAHPKLGSRRGHGSHAQIAMSKSVSPPKATPSPRYLSATHSDATPTRTTQQQNSSVIRSNLPPVPPCPAPRPHLPTSVSHPRVPPVGSPGGVISSQPTIPMALSSTEKSKLLPDLKDLHGRDQTCPNMSDKDCSYVKFPRRIDPSHEYSYPKLIDAYKPGDHQVAVTAVSTGATPPSKSGKAATPPLPPSFGGGPKVGVASVAAVTSSSNSSGSSKKSRRSLPSLVLSCGGGRGQSSSGSGHCGGGGGTALCGGGDGGLASDASLSHAHFDSSLSPERDSSESTLSHLCIHCRKSYNPGFNGKGSCRYAPNDWARATVETVTCLSCARCLLYHCISDPDEDEDIHDPCECTGNGSASNRVRRWLGLTLLSILVPCLCCYPPLMACYKGAAACGLCGGRHEASKGQLS